MGGVRRPTRAELATLARMLAGHGLIAREIAPLLGVGRGYVQQLLTDPDGSRERARKERYRIPCPGCGRLLNGSDGRGPHAPTRCLPCRALDAKVWDQAALIEAGRAFAAIHGRAPAACDWNVSQARALGHDERVKRYEEEGWPPTGACQREFGSWSAFIAACGFPPAPTGRPGSARLAAERSAS